jgi:hypothetical protein
VVTTSLERAIRDLRVVLVADTTAPGWRRLLRRRLSQVRDALADPEGPGVEAWLVGRQVASHRCRRQLQARVATLAAGILDRLDTEAATTELRRLQADLEHYLQRVHDLVYDAVTLELGGSE